MAEIQTNTESGQMTQQFIEFVMMQSQNAALFLGQIPNPQTGEPEINLELARMFIDQLVMIREKTRGNLNSDEQKVITNAIGGLQMAFVEASQGGGATVTPSRMEHSQEVSSFAEPSTPEAAAPATEVQAEGEVADAPAAAPDTDSRKRFTKSYG